MAEDRRTFLKIITGAIGTGAAATVGAPIAGAVLTPYTKNTVIGAQGFIAVADLAALPDDGSPLAVSVMVEKPTDAWLNLPPTQVGGAFCRKLEGAPGAGPRIEVFSTICPHLGCQVDYRGDQKRFGCPCHDSLFALDGKVQSGPSPRPLDVLESRVVNGKIEIRYQRFKTGVPEKKQV